MKNPVVAFPVWFAFAGGLVEVVILCIKRARNPLMVLSPEFARMAPLMLVLLVVAVVGALALVGLVWRSKTFDRVRLFVPLSLVALDLFMLVPGLAHYAAAILAAGAGVQLSRLVLAHPEATRTLQRRTGGWIASALLIAGFFVPMAVAPRQTATVPDRTDGSPNVILITLDTVRAANMGLYGYARSTTPNIDAFAREKRVVFSQAFSTAPWTLPSHASMFTGRWPHELSADHDTPLDGTYPTLAEYLRDRGYVTGGFAANLKYCGRGSGLSRGFSHYEDYRPSLREAASSSTLVRTVADNFRLRRLIQDDEHLNRITASQTTGRALAWILDHRDRPFFAFLNYFDAHEPYLPPPPYDRKFGPGRAQGKHSPLHHWLWNPAVQHQSLDDTVKQEEIDAYDGALAKLDDELGSLLLVLEKSGVLENTLVIITSDHGEEFAEHGVYEHGYSLYRPGVQVPLIVKPPRSQRSAVRDSVSEAPVSLRDLAATIVDVLGLGAGSPFPGVSLARLWHPLSFIAGPIEVSPVLTEVSPSPGQPDWFPSSKGEMKSIVYQGLRYIRNGDGSEELYDSNPDHDQWERHNLVAKPEYQQQLVGARALLQRVLAGGS